MAALGFVRNNPWVLKDKGHHEDFENGDSKLSRLSPETGTTKGDPLPFRSSSALNQWSAVLEQPWNGETSDGDAYSDGRPSESSCESEISYGPGIVRRLRERFLQLAASEAAAARSRREAHAKRAHSVDTLLDSDDPPSARGRSASTQDPEITATAQPSRLAPIMDKAKPVSLSQSSLHSFSSREAPSVLQSDPREIPDPHHSLSAQAPIDIRSRKSFFESKEVTGLRPKLQSTGSSSDSQKNEPSSHGGSVEPEFLSMKRKLKPVAAVSSTETELKSPPDPGSRESEELGKDSKPLFIKSSPHESEDSHPQRFTHSSDLSPPPEEPLPPTPARLAVSLKSSAVREDSKEESDNESVMSSDDESGGFYQVNAVEGEENSAREGLPKIVDDGFSSVQDATKRRDIIASQEEGTDSGFSQDFPDSSDVPQKSIVDLNTLNGETAAIRDKQDALRDMAITIAKYHQETVPANSAPVKQKSQPPEREMTIEDLMEAKLREAQEMKSHTLHHIGTHLPDGVDEEGSTHFPKGVIRHPVPSSSNDPIQQTILSLVSEEDMEEFMKEEKEIFFEFLGDGVIASPSILSSPQRKQMKGGSVAFRKELPSAYAYLAEEVFDVGEPWERGVEVKNEQYMELCQLVRDEYVEKKLKEIQQQRTDLVPHPQVPNPGNLSSIPSGGLVNFVPSHMSPGEYELGVTNRWAYGDSPSQKSPQPSAPSTNGEPEENLSVRPDPTSSSFSKMESNTSDLLF